ncbi:hypothetical protein R5R35_006645 [Gryllus longicercus]|uniref:Uncharacterized protein n=1 Tax=Gryllus longicercus TaxID=2509291 RepID=A0AAN9Z2I1_9ORTH
MSTATGLKLDPADPAVRRLVYNAYRGLLCGYNDKANVLLAALPPGRVREDEGIAGRLESMIRQSSQLSGDGSPSPGAVPAGDGVSAPAPPPPPPPFPSAAPASAPAPPPGGPPAPPPPPPPGPGRVPAVRLNTEIPDNRGPREPPAAIQNAMMTKDKKPFTYTPGGLDLSQIRSPRMQRRIVRNAANEGVGEAPAPKPSPLAQSGAPLPPSALAAMQPALPVAVFPPAGAPAPSHHAPAHVAPQQPPPPPAPRAASPPPPPAPPQQQQARSPPAAAAGGRPNEPGSIYVPPVAPPAERRSQVGSLYIPPVTQQQQQSPPAVMSPGPMSPVTLNKAPTPWLTQRQQQTQPSVPPWAQPRAPPQQLQQPAQQQQQQQQQRAPSPPRSAPPPHQQQQQQQQQQQGPGTRIIPIQVEGREPPRAAAPSPSPQAGGRPQPFQQQQQQQQQYQQQQHAAAPSPPGTRIIPIQIEGAAPPAAPTPAPPHHQPQSPQNMQQRRPVYVHNKFSPPSPACTPSPAHDSAPAQSPRQLQQQHSWGTGGGPASPAPIQSRSFRVLQKITDTDQSEDEQTSQQNQWSQQTPQQSQWNPQSTQGVPVHELRKLQLSEDDRALMNKFKAQVDEDSFLHNESDPRYRGASIPSRAFRMLQSMTDGAGGDYADQHQVPRGGGPVRSGPPTMSAHQAATESAPQPYIPPSEQQVPEPRKYVGGSIPSRSFRMLQAMTGSPESCASVTSPDGRETPVSVSKQGYDENGAGLWGPYDPNMSPYPPYWCPEAWWGYYPPPEAENQSPSQQRQQQNQTPVPQEFWDPYAAMYAYNAAYGYPPMPYPMYPPPPFAPPFRYPHSGSDSDEYSGYSSTDEMAYYSAKFARGAHLMNGVRPPMTPRSCVTSASNQASTPASDSTPTPTPSTVDKASSEERNEKDKAGKVKTMLENKAQDSESSVTPAESSSSVSAPEEESSAQSSSDEESSGSDTEVEEEQDSKPLDKKGNGSGSGSALQMIRSVSDINVYKNNSKSEVGDSETNDEETEQEESEEEEEEEEDEEVEEENENEEREEHLPHQLSVIFEESEQSDVESVKHAKSLGNSSESVNPSEDGDSSTATLDDGDDDDDDESDVDFDSVDPASSTVTVRLPLKLKFSRSANNEEVTTVIVGNSQVKRTEAELESFTKEVTPKEKEETVVAGGKDNAVKDSAAKESTTKGSAAKDSACGKVDVGGRRDSDTPNVSVTLSFPSKSSPASSPTETPGSRFSDNNVCRQMSTESLDVYETCESDSDVSVCLSLPLRKKTSVKNSPRSTPTISNISEEEDDESKTKADESDTLSHWDDDSSSTSIQTVKLSSGSGRSTASDIGSKSENEDATVRNKNLKGKQHPSKIVRKQEFVTIKETPVDTEQPPKEISKNDSSSESESESESEEESLESPKEKNGSINEVKTEISSSKTKEEDNIALTNGKTNNEEDDSSEESEESEEEDENETDAETAVIVKKIYDICTKSDSKLNQIQQKLEKINEAEENKNNCESISRNNKEIDGENENDTRRSNSKLQEESEEDDSGVTSDMSRQISDADTDGDSNLNELQLQCQRVATHSRLFKLLQDECSKSDDEDEDDNVKEDQEKNEKEVKSVGKLKSRKEHLSLPLRHNNLSDPDSLSSSSGVTSPASPTVTARLVKELVQTLLQRKKGRRLKKLPIAKLHAAALRLLQEDMDPYDTVSSAGSEEGNNPYHSPVKARGKPQHSNITNTATPATPVSHNTASTPLPAIPSPAHMMYGANYYDYCDYYNSWANAAYYGADPAFEYNIVPSRAFKLLQEHAQPSGFSSGVINGLWGKCPRIPSSKNLQKDLAQAGIVKENLNKTANLTDNDTPSKSSVPSESPSQPLASTRAT